MAYKGKYRPRNPEKYKGNPNEVIYRSMWEKYCFKWADMSSDVKSWSSEETVVPYFYEVDKKWHRYFIDMKVTFSTGRTVLIEIKPFKETQTPEYPGRRTKRYLTESMTYIKNQNKWKAAEKFAEERGWDFEIWTERELEKMGLMPKSKKGFKRIEPFRPYSKKKPT